MKTKRVNPPQAVVAGHVCLDILPSFPASKSGGAVKLVPGQLFNVGPAVRATGGAVPNTGLALHRLGVSVTLMGKIGDDLFGTDVLNIIRSIDTQLSRGMVIVPGQPTSYTVVISPPGVDRLFLHCPGCNDTFGAADIDAQQLRGARLFHFGYPPLMRRLHENEGRELAKLLAIPKKMGLTVSLDMSRPDPSSDSGRVNWERLFARVLPQVDVFLPSVEELLFMIDRKRYDAMIRDHGEIRVARDIDGDLLSHLSSRLLDMGVAVVVIKLGDQGLYLRTTAKTERLERMGRAKPNNLPAWLGRELIAPCFQVKVAGTTGSGDCTIAGFLAALLRGQLPETAITTAVGVGACNVERVDALSGIPAWKKVQQRIARRWKRRASDLRLPMWKHHADDATMIGPHDVGQEK